MPGSFYHIVCKTCHKSFTDCSLARRDAEGVKRRINEQGATCPNPQMATHYAIVGLLAEEDYDNYDCSEIR